MREISLREVIRAGRLAGNTSPEGAELRYKPDQQLLGRGAIIEVRWLEAERGKAVPLVEVAPDASGELGVALANVASGGFSTGNEFRLPNVPATGWWHEEDCDCAACRNPIG